MDYLETIRPFFLIAYYVFVSFIVVVIILDNKKPEKSFAFIFLVLLFPIAGILIYLLFGAQYQKKKLFTKKRYFEKVYLHKSVPPKDREELEIEQSYSKLPTLFYNIEQVSFTLHNKLEILVNGEQKFPRLMSEMENAKHSIHLEYYIFKESNIGAKIIDLLCRKAKQGVKVRMIYDDVGSSLKRKSLKKLKDSGVECYPYMPVLFSRLAHKANYRNHRKIVVIDNEIGFLGGINVNDKYINTIDRDLYWRDTHISIKGEAVIDLQYLFISDWYFVSGKMIDLEEVRFLTGNKMDNQVATSILGSDYGKNNQTIMEAFFGMITSARKEILITTPYFVPDETIFNALKISAKSGVKIKIIIPRNPDIKTAHYASQTYMKSLIQSGVEVYYYNKGMMHSKIMVVDGIMSTVGSTNIDQRSFSLNAEVNAFIIDETFARELIGHFNKDLKDSYLLTIEELLARPWYVKVLCSLARLMAPIL